MKALLASLLLSGCTIVSLPFSHRNVNVYDRQNGTTVTRNEMRVVIDYAFSQLGNKKFIRRL